MARSVIPTTGLWSTITTLLNQNFTEAYETPHFGIYDYNDLGTSVTPISVPGTNTYVELTNDGNGDFTNTGFGLPQIANIYNTSTNRFDWTGLELGDTVDIRVDIQVTTTTANQQVDLDLEMATGSAFPYDILLFKSVFKSAGANDINRFNGIYMGNTDTRDNPARLKIRSDAAATVLVRGWYVRVFPRILKV